MKIFEIINQENSMSLGHLLAFEKDKNFIVELRENLDEWTAPLLFAPQVKKHIFTIPRNLCLAWICERIVPSNRQNIGMILSNHKLKTYDELKILEITGGRCSQDNYVLQKTDEIPEYIINRMKKNLTELVISEDSVLVFFADETVRKIPLDTLFQIESAEKLSTNRLLLESGQVGSGGYYATFNDSIDIPASILYKAGIKLPLKKSDFVRFATKNILDTAESCRILECTRQNIAYLIDKKHLSPVKENVKGNLYLKGDLLKNRE